MGYTVVYQKGGYTGPWCQTVSVCSLNEAFRMRDSIVKAGRPAKVYETKDLDKVWIPEGPCYDWDYQKLRWKV